MDVYVKSVVSVIFNVGFSSDYIIKIMTQRGVEGVDRAYLVTALAKEEYARKRNEDAMHAVISYLNVVGVEDVRPVPVDLDRGFEDILLQVSLGLGKLDGEVEVYLVGGVRVLLLALYYLAQVLDAFVKVKAISYDENMQHSYLLPLRPPRVPRTQAQVELLRALTTRQSVGELAERLGKSQSTVLKQLESLGELVECDKVGRERVCEASVLGRVILNLMGVA